MITEVSVQFAQLNQQRFYLSFNSYPFRSNDRFALQDNNLPGAATLSVMLTLTAPNNSNVSTVSTASTSSAVIIGAVGAACFVILVGLIALRAVSLHRRKESEKSLAVAPTPQVSLD